MDLKNTYFTHETSKDKNKVVKNWSCISKYVVLQTSYAN
jgi:hypothetical protein